MQINIVFSAIQHLLTDHILHLHLNFHWGLFIAPCACGKKVTHLFTQNRMLVDLKRYRKEFCKEKVKIFATQVIIS